MLLVILMGRCSFNDFLKEQPLYILHLSNTRCRADITLNKRFLLHHDVIEYILSLTTAKADDE